MPAFRDSVVFFLPTVMTTLPLAAAGPRETKTLTTGRLPAFAFLGASSLVVLVEMLGEVGLVVGGATGGATGGVTGGAATVSSTVAELEPARSADPSNTAR